MAHQLILINFLFLQAKGLAVDGAPELVNGRLAPAAGMVAKAATIGNGGVEPRYLEVGIGGGRPVALHSDQPGRWHFVRIGTDGHAQGGAQVVR